MNNLFFKYSFVFLSLCLIACQSKIEKIGQEHAEEVAKWQELARFAGNELKYLGLTVTAEVKTNKNAEETSYSIVNVQLNQDANQTEIDLLSPEFAEKFACGKKCEKLGLYDSNFTKQATQLSSLFFTEEGRFFEFYGQLSQLNEILANYRASSPAILKNYLTLMLNQKLAFNSLSEFFDHLQMYVTEDKLLAFSKSGFISPVSDRLSSTFLNDLIANLPKNWDVVDLITPNDEWNASALTPDELLLNNFLNNTTPTTETIRENWRLAKRYTIQVGSIVCSYSDNIFGLVTGIDNSKITLDVIAQAQMLVDGVKQHTPQGYLFTAPESFYFIKAPLNETYPQSDIATCNVEHLKRGQI